MTKAKRDQDVDPINATSAPDSLQEVLLGDLAGTDEAEHIFERIADLHEGMMATPVTVTISDGADLTGGDVDDDSYQASVVGEEAVGGQNPTPDQNVTEELQQSIGISTADGELVHTEEMIELRDRRRWELDPESSEDYSEHA
jgi:hypothetical protein